MRSQIEKFERVISFNKIDDTTVKDLARAICMADILHGTNDKKLSIHRLEVSGVDCLSNLSIGGSSGVFVSPLPDVQIMRVMCDIIYYSLLFKGRVITDTHLTSGASNMVSKGLKRNDGSLEVAYHDYCDFDECAKLLDVYTKKCDELTPVDCSDIFEYTSDILKDMKTLFDRIDKERDCYNYAYFKNIYLPSDYSSYGFEVEHKFPNKLKVVTKDCQHDFTEMWNLMGLMEILLHYISYERRPEHEARFALVSILVDIESDYKSYLPIGLGCSISAREPLFRPANLLKVRTVEDLYNSILNKNVCLTRNSVKVFLDILLRYFNLK